MPTDYVDRGKKGSSPAGSTIFVGLRALDPFLQHSILLGTVGTSLIDMVGSTVMAMGPSSNTGYASIDALGLSPYRLALLGMATGSTLKHIFWKMALSREQMPAQAAVSISAFNTILNSLNSLIFICSATSAAYGRGEGPNWEGWPGAPLRVGGYMFAFGMLYETVAEIQRSLFKSKEGNEERMYTGGLWNWVRHPNYGGTLAFLSSCHGTKLTTKATPCGAPALLWPAAAGCGV